MYNLRFGFLHLTILGVAGALIAAVLLTLIGPGRSIPVHADGSNCASCHADRARLKSYSPRWRDIYVDPAEYAKDKHGRFACTTCHGGDQAKDSPEACAGVALKDPADPQEVNETCGSCHPAITTQYLGSLHNTLEGHKRSLVTLMGEQDGIARFNSCSSCHASCSSCHMESPDQHNRLVPRTASHSMARRPDTQVCRVCHGQTGDTFMGIAGDSKHPGSRMSAAGLDCVDCHPEKEIHGNSLQPNFINETVMPLCEECHSAPKRLVHTPVGTVAAQYDAQNAAHATHLTLSCEACHTQWYYNCWDCHQGTAGRQDRDQFFLARNRATGKIETLVHSPVSPEFGGVPAELGGWAVKTLHSWGPSQPCEKCHSDAAVYVSNASRQAPWVGYWGQSGMATFVEPELVQRLTLDPARLKQDIHQESTCLDCHQSLRNDVCQSCHEKSAPSGKTYLPAGADWSRQDYLQVRRTLDQLQTMYLSAAQRDADPATWAAERSNLENEYLEIGNEFHGNPGPAQVKIKGLRERAEATQQAWTRTLAETENRRRLWLVATPLAFGLFGFVSVGWLLNRRTKSKERNNS